jgi:hypothetical protein
MFEPGETVYCLLNIYTDKPYIIRKGFVKQFVYGEMGGSPPSYLVIMEDGTEVSCYCCCKTFEEAKDRGLSILNKDLTLAQDKLNKVRQTIVSFLERNL